jgi:short-subunit dehydrogenase
MPKDSLNQLAVVTGASSGIDFELAKQFANHGFDLLVAAKAKEKFQVAVGQVIPETIKAQQHRKISEPGSAEA